MKNLLFIFLLFLSTLIAYSQTQQYNHPKNGYGTVGLFEGNFTFEGPAYFHNWWGIDSLTSGAGLYKQTLVNNYTMLGVSGIGAEAWSLTPDWSTLDLAYHYSRNNHLKLRSNFGPGYYTPTWITGTLAQKRAQYLNRITEILTRYPEVEEWNFCNEITSSTNLNNLLGWNDVEMLVNISQHARYVLDSICSDAKLLTNDYNIISAQPNWPTTHRDTYLQLYVDAIAQGAQIDYVGVEGHIFCWANNPVWNNFSNNIQYWRWNAEVIDSLIGLPIVLTEFDISMPWDLNTDTWYVDPNLPYTDPTTNVTYSNLWEWQGYAYKAAIDTLRAIPNIINITNAGFDDGEMAWNPWVGLVNAIQLNDVALNPKPAYDSISSILQDFRNLPSASFNIKVNNTPGTRIFDAGKSTDRNGSLINYNWDFGDGNFGSGQLTNHTYTSAGTYIVQLVITDNDNNTDTISKAISICWDVQVQNTSILSGDSIFLGGNYYYNQGTYNVLITDSTGCNVVCDSLVTLNLTITPTGIENVLKQNNISVFPIPTKESISVKGNNIKQLEIISANGNTVEKVDMLRQETLKEFNVAHLSRGMYFLKITTLQGVGIKKIIIE